MKAKILITIALIVGVGLGVGGVALFGNNSVAADACAKPVVGVESHQVMIMDGKVDSTRVSAKQCETITFTNMDTVTREIAFGPHENHVPYDGVAAKVLTAGQSFTITLNQTGSFHWHDHLHDDIQGYFQVSK